MEILLLAELESECCRCGVDIDIQQAQPQPLTRTVNPNIHVIRLIDLIAAIGVDTIPMTTVVPLYLWKKQRMLLLVQYCTSQTTVTRPFSDTRKRMALFIIFLCTRSRIDSRLICFEGRFAMGSPLLFYDAGFQIHFIWLCLGF